MEKRKKATKEREKLLGKFRQMPFSSGKYKKQSVID
jgi:hypothetical protein